MKDTGKDPGLECVSADKEGAQDPLYVSCFNAHLSSEVRLEPILVRSETISCPVPSKNAKPVKVQHFFGSSINLSSMQLDI